MSKSKILYTDAIELWMDDWPWMRYRLERSAYVFMGCEQLKNVRFYIPSIKRHIEEEHAQGRHGKHDTYP